jgi:hypothetical protein
MLTSRPIYLQSTIPSSNPPPLYIIATPPAAAMNFDLPPPARSTAVACYPRRRFLHRIAGSSGILALVCPAALPAPPVARWSIPTRAHRRVGGRPALQPSSTSLRSRRGDVYDSDGLQILVPLSFNSTILLQQKSPNRRSITMCAHGVRRAPSILLRLNRKAQPLSTPRISFVLYFQISLI